MIDVNLKKDKLRVSTLGLVIALVYSIGLELHKTPDWAVFVNPDAIGGLMMAMGGAVIGWMTPRPARPSLRRNDEN